MDGQIHESKDFFNYRKEHWTTRLYYSGFFGLMIASSGVKIKGNIFETLGHWDFVYDLVACTALVYLTVYFIYWVCLILDKALPWEKKPNNRFMAQLILGVILGHQLMELLNKFYIVYGGQNLLYTQKSRTEMPMSLMVSIVVNCYYFGAYFAERHVGKGLKAPDAAAAPLLEAVESLENSDGANSFPDQTDVKHSIPLPEKEKLPLITYSDGERILVHHLDIAAVGLEGGNLAICTFSGKRYYDTRPLTSFFALLDPNDYYHTSRQTIVHRDAVRSITPSKTKKGGLDVSLTIETDIQVEVAARSVARFKAWLATGSSPSARKRSIPVPMLF